MHKSANDNYSKGIQYVIFNSESSKIFCYKYGDDLYEEFFTGYKCRLIDSHLIFDHSNADFLVTNDGNVVKTIFANELSNYIFKFGSKEKATSHFKVLLNSRIYECSKNRELKLVKQDELKKD